MNIWMIGEKSVKHHYLKRICKDLNFKKNLGKNYDLYVQVDTFLLADVFRNITKIQKYIYIYIYKLDPAKLFLAPVLA